MIPNIFANSLFINQLFNNIIEKKNAIPDYRTFTGKNLEWSI
jgi:hypothetical protein